MVTGVIIMEECHCFLFPDIIALDLHDILGSLQGEVLLSSSY